MTPCSTLEQRWSACRARVYGEPPGPEDCADEYCGQWLGDWFGDRPCSSPSRNGCRAGTTGQEDRSPYHSSNRVPMRLHVCVELPW